MTKRLEIAAVEEEKDDGGKNIKISSLEYVVIELFDFSPSGMVIGHQL